MMVLKIVFYFFLLHLFLNSQSDHVQGNDDYANVTLVQSAVQSGAVCLDGSPPGYAMAKGSGSGSNNWLVYLEGGGWCHTTANCANRASKDDTGSSLRRTRIYFGGILAKNETFNPDFYNWNRVFAMYCDGSSFLGDVEEIDPETNLFYRGSRVFDALMEELLSKGMYTADNVILSGTSAGGLATIMHCDKFRALLPNAQRVKCFSDSGFFLHASNLPGAMNREDYFFKVIKLHGLERFLPESCTSTQTNLSLCMFPENLVDALQSPLFLLESSFDSYQLQSLITPYIGGGWTEWYGCLNNLQLCNSTQLGILREFKETFVQTLHDLPCSSSRGLFVHTSYQHGHVYAKQYWKCSCLINIVLLNKNIADAFGDWYFDRNAFQQIDTFNTVPRNCTSTLGAEAFDEKCIQLIG